MRGSVLSAIGEGMTYCLNSSQEGAINAYFDLSEAHHSITELVEAVRELKDVCRRPSAARTRAQSWRRLDAAINAMGEKS